MGRFLNAVCWSGLMHLAQQMAGLHVMRSFARNRLDCMGNLMDNHHFCGSICAKSFTETTT